MTEDEEWTSDFIAEVTEVLHTEDVRLVGDELVCSFVVREEMSAWTQPEPVTVRVHFGSPAAWGADEKVTPGEAAWTSFHDMVTETLDMAALGSPSRRWPVVVENWHPHQRRRGVREQ